MVNLTNGWNRVGNIAGRNWRRLTGSSPYTILATDQEFMVELRENQSSGATQEHANVFAIRAQLGTTGKRIVEQVENPDGSSQRWVGADFTLSSATQLRAALTAHADHIGSYTLVAVYAR